jgi:hypothetical protein
VTPDETDDTVDRVIEHALDAYGALTELGEAIDDEWTYVDDLSRAWRDRLEEVAAARHGERLDPTVVSAIDGAAAEARRITDPHRAIDWLSTFPQVVLVALREPS